MTITPALHARVLALRRTQSARAVAQALNIPLGTVKAISSRAGLTRDNAKLRAFFRLPEPTASTCTDLQPPVAPPSHCAGCFHGIRLLLDGYRAWLPSRLQRNHGFLDG